MAPAAGDGLPRHLDRVVAAWDYDGIARALVLALKLRGRRSAGPILAQALATRVWAEGCGADALVWVPGRRADIRRRGFDHAALLARELSRLLGIPSIPALHRAGDRIDQAGLNAVQRRSNLAGAFEARGVPMRVAIVDDVMTTGATLAEAGRALRRAGADHIEGLVACRVG
jgi:ComF family protein